MLDETIDDAEILNNMPENIESHPRDSELERPMKEDKKKILADISPYER